MKKFTAILSMFIITVCLTGCGDPAEISSSSQAEPAGTAETSAAAGTNEVHEESSEGETEAAEIPEDTSGSKVLVAYFSATGTTKMIAEAIAAETGADVFEIVPAEPYSDADLNYNDDSCRANREQNDASARPEIAGSVDISSYDTIFVGYPIWWAQAPKIMYTFMESYDFSEKTIIPF